MNKLHGRPQIHETTPEIAHKRMMDRRRYYALSNTDPVQSWAKVALNNARQRARRKELDFTLTIDDVIALADTVTHCPIFGVRLEYHRGRGDGPRPFAASIDRADNSDGYHKHNVRIISQRANTVKGKCSLHDLVAFGRYAMRMLQAA